ncbi:MAG: primosomal replication protein N [Burkholderiales bacterium]|nr:primosomal replication protein N [Burkholderiales bacterium]
MNQLVLSARIVQRDALRYTPAGLPVVDLRLAHESERFQEGQTRKLSLEVTACALGELARDLVNTALGTAGNFTGFLVKHRNGRGVMLQIESFSALPPDPTPPN